MRVSLATAAVAAALALAVALGPVLGIADSTGSTGASDRSGKGDLVLAAAGADCAVLAPGASAVAESAVRAACSQLGTWYTWGGGHGARPGPTYGHPDGVDPASDHDAERLGFDCSGLVRYAYARATGQDVLNGPAAEQFYTVHAAQRLTADQVPGSLLPGDLIAYGSSAALHHIAVYLGAGRMVEARQSGTRVAVNDVRFGSELFGAVRIDPGPVQGHLVGTWGTGVWTHAQPAAESTRVYAFAGPTVVRVGCQQHAQSVTAEGITNDAWSFLPDYRAWISNIYLQGGYWLDGVPACG
ncbi:C40 family peptidase [Kitasatospora sp. NPDC056138]|uniref:C40 family peptidase n=1 Tax=Kitasatospora sp. NPDC056138 TaxID=3345724 RepID=UPI0035D7748A